MPKTPTTIPPDKTLRDLVAAYAGQIQGDTIAKVAFHKLAKKFCKQIATDLGLSKDSYSIRTNLGGDGVGGDTMLHSDIFYLNFSGEKLGALQILYRKSPGRDIFRGHGSNTWTTYQEVEADYELFLTKLTMVGATA